MEGKMSKSEKIIELLAFVVFMISVIIKSILGTKDAGVLVMLAFLGVLVYVILFVCAFFPADWRMTEKQKEKIENKEAHQAMYRKICVICNMLFMIGVSGIILFVG